MSVFFNSELICNYGNNVLQSQDTKTLNFYVCIGQHLYYECTIDKQGDNIF